jgi:hypothetical protein
LSRGEKRREEKRDVEKRRETLRGGKKPTEVERNVEDRNFQKRRETLRRSE